MTRWTALGRAVAMSAIVLCSAPVRGEPADPCAVPGYLRSPHPHLKDSIAALCQGQVWSQARQTCTAA